MRGGTIFAVRAFSSSVVDIRLDWSESSVFMT